MSKEEKQHIVDLWAEHMRSVIPTLATVNYSDIFSEDCDSERRDKIWSWAYEWYTNK